MISTSGHLIPKFPEVRFHRTRIFKKYVALVSTTAEKTRVSSSQIGNAFKTIFSRISRSKDGLTTDAEMSDAEAALKSVGVSVRGADGDLRDISDTLDDLNKICIMQ